MLAEITDASNSIEIRTGPFTLLDLRCLARYAKSGPNGETSLNWDDIAVTILTEVSSLYPGRGENGTLEALIDIGLSTLTGEEHDAYPGFGGSSQWNMEPSLESHIHPMSAGG